MWIARDRDNSLWIYYRKPVFNDEYGIFSDPESRTILEVPEDEYPEVTVDSSPVKLMSSIKYNEVVRDDE